MSLLDYLFPKKCVNCKKFGSYICPSCFSYIAFLEHGTCVICQRQAIYGITHPGCKTKYSIEGVLSSVVYTGVVKKLIYTFKYPPYLTTLQGLLIDLFYEGMIQKEPFMKLISQKALFIPIPLHVTKYRKRGYNQAKILAAGLGKKLSIPVVDGLDRIKNTKTQVGLSQTERQENIKEAFAIKEQLMHQLQEYRTIFLVDDVSTSGSTMKEAAKLLKKAGIETVWGITLAHGQ